MGQSQERRNLSEITQLCKSRHLEKKLDVVFALASRLCTEVITVRPQFDNAVSAYGKPSHLIG